MTLFIAFLASFAGTIAGLANIAGYGVQAAVYHTTVVRVSYAVSPRQYASNFRMYKSDFHQYRQPRPVSASA